MEFFFIFTLWLLELHTITAMVDYLSNIEGWLDEATLFPAEHNGFLNFDDPLNSLKTNNDGLSDNGSGLQWLEDTNVTDALISEFFKSYPDFHLFDPEGLISCPDDMKTEINSIPETSSGSPSLFKSYPNLLQFDTEGLISPLEDIKTEINSIPETNSSTPSSPVSKSIPLSPPYYESISEASSPASYLSVDSTLYGLGLSPTSSSDKSHADSPPVTSVNICKINTIPETNSSTPSSPVSKSIPLSPPYFESISEASSPASYISVDSTLYGLGLSPTSGSDGSRADSPLVVSVTICENAEIGSEPPVPMTIEEVVSSVKEKKYLNASKGKVPKVQVSLKNTFHPYSKTKSGSRRKRTSDPGERKKVQNKEAAARYRTKKKSEEEQLSHVANNLEKEQGELQSKHDDILSEIKYLKSLMCEMLQKKGLM